ncbi:hypothetical protein [Janthinobacterium lividum]|uniref:hypothetical protein n=1 Tax=Janthinobacterium lividum TaxID=29581 RepID=UPI001B824A29|nr:hypothetical protein [Janthinobacterium lividum]MBR7634274.1 hypothetical protein [Janthinobacterium lividum]
MQHKQQLFQSVIQEKWDLLDLSDDARALHDALLDYEGDGVYADLLIPWLHDNPHASAWLRSFAQRQGNPVPSASKEELWALHAFSRICQVLVLPLQQERGNGEGWAGPPLLLAEYEAFVEALGMTVLWPAQFSPFYHEIVELKPAESARAPAAIMAWRWPCVMLGNMLFSRGGVDVCAGKTVFKPGIADASTLYWADRLKGRPVNDLSHGWGGNSQWRTSFRRDYILDDTRFYNVDGKHDLTAKTADAGGFSELTLVERVELLTQRCLVSSTKAHDDLWPYDDCWRESADNDGLPGRWSRWLSFVRDSGMRAKRA